MKRGYRTTRQPWFAGLAAGLLVAHAGLVGWISLRTSPVMDEAGHLAAGIYAWKVGRYDVYRVNPPLVRMLAALPVVVAGADLRWNVYADGPAARPEWSLGHGFVEANDRGDGGWFWYFVMARWACIPLSLLGGYACWRWASDLYGQEPGLLALGLWCFSPNVLAWAATISPDAGAAAVGVAACYVYWRWLQGPSWPRAAGAGVALALALLTKTTWIVLLGVWPLLWIVWQWGRRRRRSRQIRPASGGQLAAIFLLGVYVLNVGYAFEGSFKRLGAYVFVSRSLAGDESLANGGSGGNRFAGRGLAALPVPLPENFVRGIDLQKADFENGKQSYLGGRWRDGGWWYYYLYAMVLKEPLGTWILALIAALLTLTGAHAHRGPTLGPTGAARGYSAGWRNELAVLLPAVVVFVLVSSQTGFSRYFRYVLPCFPFAFVWVSKVARVRLVGQCDRLRMESGSSGSRRAVSSSSRLDPRSATHPVRWGIAAPAVGAAFVWSVASSLAVYPHSMSYFNELGGGPTRGHYYLIDANVDWGQDIWYLKRWLDRHPEARPLHMACVNFIEAKHFGIEYKRPPDGPQAHRGYADANTRVEASGPLPGWYAMSIHRIHNTTQNYLYFLHFRPVAMAGCSIYIYHITLDEANRVRRELGLPELTQTNDGDTVNVGD